MRVLCLQVCLCQTCSDKELLYFFDMRFLIVSLTDLTFLPSEIRDVVGDFTTSLYIGSCSLFCNYKGSENRERWTKEQGDDGEETNERKEEKTAEKRSIQCDRRVQLVVLTASSNFTSTHVCFRACVDHMERAVGQVKASEAAGSLWGSQNTIK